MQPPIESTTLRRPPGTSSDLRKPQKTNNIPKRSKMPRQCGPTFQRSSSRTVRVRPIVGIALFPYSSSFLQRCGGGVNRGVEECQVLPGRVSVVFSGTPPSPSPVLRQRPVDCTTPTPTGPWPAMAPPRGSPKHPRRPRKATKAANVVLHASEAAQDSSKRFPGPGRARSRGVRAPKMAKDGSKRASESPRWPPISLKIAQHGSR